jgi:hypothetical protein
MCDQNQVSPLPAHGRGLVGLTLLLHCLGGEADGICFSRFAGGPLDSGAVVLEPNPPDGRAVALIETGHGSNIGMLARVIPIPHEQAHLRVDYLRKATKKIEVIVGLI